MGIELGSLMPSRSVIIFPCLDFLNEVGELLSGMVIIDGLFMFYQFKDMLCAVNIFVGLVNFTSIRDQKSVKVVFLESNCACNS